MLWVGRDKTGNSIFVLPLSISLPFVEIEVAYELDE
jgi:hypothetical protein